MPGLLARRPLPERGCVACRLKSAIVGSGTYWPVAQSETITTGSERPLLDSSDDQNPESWK